MRLLTPADVSGAADAIAAGFFDNEIWAWIVPSDSARTRLLRRYYRTTIRHIFMPMETAWTTAGHTGAALWCAPGTWPLERRQLFWEMLATIPWIGMRGAMRGSEVERVTARHHPAEPHWYLQTLAIDPPHQRSGHGAALLEPGLQICDETSMPAYLETQRESNIPYYARFGFELVEELRIPAGPSMWAMCRPKMGA